MVFNPRISDDTFVSWLRAVMLEAAAELPPLD